MIEITAASFTISSVYFFFYVPRIKASYCFIHQLFTTHQQLNGAKEELRNASLQAQEQKETLAILKQKCTAAVEEVHRVQGQVEHLEEELRYSHQQVQ